MRIVKFYGNNETKVFNFVKVYGMASEKYTVSLGFIFVIN